MQQVPDSDCFEEAKVTLGRLIQLLIDNWGVNEEQAAEVCRKIPDVRTGKAAFERSFAFVCRLGDKEGFIGAESIHKAFAGGWRFGPVNDRVLLAFIEGWWQDFRSHCPRRTTAAPEEFQSLGVIRVEGRPLQRPHRHSRRERKRMRRKAKCPQAEERHDQKPRCHKRRPPAMKTGR